METIHTVGKRKTAIARIFLSQGTGEVSINGRKLDEYFGGYIRQKMSVMEPLQITQSVNKYDLKASVRGGGVTAQAEAVRHAVAKALAQTDAGIRLILKKKGMLTRDARIVERKKPGRPKARKSFQFSKR
ncbi:MAG TPA: 30S ribosomal protein S9 [bacterium]|nr:30S ribosomal protein S9 [bacterium]